MKRINGMDNWQVFKVPIIITMLLIFLFRAVLLIGIVPSSSMEPTLPAGSIIVGLRIHREVRSGDIIVFRRDGVYMVKRIKAVEGDCVIHNGVEMVVPENGLYVVGDNEEESYDSRFWEEPFLKEHEVVAIVLTNDERSAILTVSKMCEDKGETYAAGGF